MARSVPVVCNDLDKIDPTFRAKVELLCQLMRDRGWNPRVHETLRTPERGAYLASIGRSKNGAKSIHTIGLAADIVDADLDNHPRVTKEGWWDAPAKFWSDLEDVAISIGLSRLFKPGTKHVVTDEDPESWDLPHVQAVSVGEQNKVRRMTADQRAEYVRQKFGGEQPRQE